MVTTGEDGGGVVPVGLVVVGLVVDGVVGLVVVVGDDPWETATGVPQCQPPLVLHTVTIMSVGVCGVSVLKLTPVVLGSATVAALTLL